MPGIGSDNTSTADDSQSNDVPTSNMSENVDVTSPVTVATPGEAANHEARRLQVVQDHTAASDDVNLANVDHIQTVVTAPPPTTSYDYYPGLCPICGDRISGISSCFSALYNYDTIIPGDNIYEVLFFYAVRNGP